MAVSLVAAAAAVVGAVMLTSGPPAADPAATSTTAGVTPTTAAPTPPSTLAADALTTFADRDPATGFVISYPRAWEQLASDDQSVRLAARESGINGFTVRVQRFEQATTAENLVNIKAVTDGVVGSNDTAQVLDQKEVTIDGMPGYFYFYTYVDEGSGERGVHFHYFLFRGRKANQIVFQSSEADADRLQPIFEQIVSSFRSDPDI
ncbi:MAG: PsbP-related protein [Acidimicrobiales bacterium]